MLTGPLLGAVAAELLTGCAWKQGFRSGAASVLGLLFRTLARLGIAGVMAAWILREITPVVSPCLPWD